MDPSNWWENEAFYRDRQDPLERGGVAGLASLRGAWESLKNIGQRPAHPLETLLNLGMAGIGTIGAPFMAGDQFVRGMADAIDRGITGAPKPTTAFTVPGDVPGISGEWRPADVAALLTGVGPTAAAAKGVGQFTARLPGYIKSGAKTLGTNLANTAEDVADAAMRTGSKARSLLGNERGVIDPEAVKAVRDKLRAEAAKAQADIDAANKAKAEALATGVVPPTTPVQTIMPKRKPRQGRDKGTKRLLAENLPVPESMSAQMKRWDDLAEKAAAGDVAAKEQLIGEANRFIKPMVKQHYTKYGAGRLTEANLEDLSQNALLQFLRRLTPRQATSTGEHAKPLEGVVTKTFSPSEMRKRHLAKFIEKGGVEAEFRPRDSYTQALLNRSVEDAISRSAEYRAKNVVDRGRIGDSEDVLSRLQDETVRSIEGSPDLREVLMLAIDKLDRPMKNQKLTRSSVSRKEVLKRRLVDGETADTIARYDEQGKLRETPLNKGSVDVWVQRGKEEILKYIEELVGEEAAKSFLIQRRKTATPTAVPKTD